MPSPFPGMNPYLEQPRVWPGFHEQFIAAVSQSLNAQLGEAYIALVEEQIYVHEVGQSPGRLAGRADVGVVGPAAAAPREPVAILDAPARVVLPAADVESLSRVEIRTRDDEELVTVIEVLSPTSKKSGPHRDQYLAKRAQVTSSDAHFVEVDLLRGWGAMPMENEVAAAYRVLVSRVEARPDAGLWPTGLREPLPIVPVPLRGPDRDVKIDLQALLHHVYDVGAYRKLIYRYQPDPPLAPEDAPWARSVLERAGIA